MTYAVLAMHKIDLATRLDLQLNAGYDAVQCLVKSYCN